MANQQHVDILKQGVEVWNKWREEYPDIRPNLSYAKYDEFEEIDLREVNFINTDLTGAFFIDANLKKASFNNANLIGTVLVRTNLIGADFRQAHFFRGILNRADFSRAMMFLTTFQEVDLSVVKGLGTVRHVGPSTVGIDTIIRSQGKIPDIFLRGAGVPSSIIEQIPALVGSLKPIDFYSCFISYSSKDQDFAERLYADLQAKGVRCWLDKEDIKIGEKFRPRINEAIQQHDKLLLVLSEHSVRSTWVETEVETAFEKERRYKKLVLFPIKLDEAVIRTRQAWAADIRRQRHIGDFTCWKDHDTYQEAFTHLLRDLKTEAQKMGSRDASTNDR